MKAIYKISSIYALILLICGCKGPEDSTDMERMAWGKHRLLESLERITGNPPDSTNIIIEMNIDQGYKSGTGEGFDIVVDAGNITINADGPAGAMYGALSLAEKLDHYGKVPDSLIYSDHPALSMRGTCILLMKQGSYNYPVTPEEFPFFYDKDMWIDYLDFLAQNRFNYVAFWNGHPFAYFAKLNRYPEAQAGMDPELLQQNHDMLLWLTREGEKRNIRFMFEFYNIHTSVYYQKAHDLPAEISEPTPELENYTAYCIERFVQEFPNVGLYVTPGEALNPSDAPYWLNEVIFPAVLRTGKTPPVMIRAWGIELGQGRAIAGYYPDLYFERKFNVEMIADTRIDPENRAWAELTGNYTVNIHCVANLEPFRWNPPEYIQQIMQNSKAIGANGLHLYPRKAWRWPYGCDTGSKQLQWERDELWFRMWGRYAWNPERDPETEDNYWMSDLSSRYGSKEAARLLLIAFRAGADVLPALQRLLWIGYDNHTVVTAGIRLSDYKYAAGIPFLSLEPVERIPDFFSRLKTGKPGSATSPLDFLAGKLAESRIALEHIQEARRAARKNDPELERLEVDAEAIMLTVRFYLEKLEAAAMLAAGDEKISGRKEKNAFLDKLRASVDTYRKLSDLTGKYYESISDVPAWTPDRIKKVPYHWRDILPVYQKEYEVYADEFKQAEKPGYHDPDLPGLAGIWYGDPGLKNIKGPDPLMTLDQDWSDQKKQRESRWSAEWFGNILAAESGMISFSVNTGQEVILEIDRQYSGRFTIDSSETRLVVPMEKGKKYPIRLVYNHYGGDAVHMTVYCALNEGERSPVSPGVLFHALSDKAKMDRILRLRETANR